eukprot:scaffold226401_cov39-Tisochrysis_lutea.AAC.3
MRSTYVGLACRMRSYVEVVDACFLLLLTPINHQALVTVHTVDDRSLRRSRHAAARRSSVA